MNDENKTLDDLIAFIQNEMATMTPTHEDYINRLTQLKKLYELKAIDRPPRVSPDAVLAVAGNVLMVVIMVAYERNHVMMSKALSLLKRTT